MGLNNRELATVILVALIALLVVVRPSLRAGVGGSIWGLIKALISWQVQVILWMYLAYAAAVAVAGYSRGWWQWSYLKDTVVLVLFVGLPIIFNLPVTRKDSAPARSVLVETVGLSALMAFYLGLEPLPLVAELLLQPLLIFCAGMSAYGCRRPEAREAKIVADVVLLVAAVGIGVRTLSIVIGEWGRDEWTDTAVSFTLSVLYPVALLPLIYVLGLVLHLQWALHMLNFLAREVDVPRRVGVAVVLGTRARISYSAELRGGWLMALGGQSRFSDAVKMMAAFRDAVRKRNSAMREFRSRRRRMKGNPGSDEACRALDRREFHETKEYLEALHRLQTAWGPRNVGQRFRTDGQVLLSAASNSHLADATGVELVVSPDRRSWFARRCTPGGLWLGIGGVAATSDEWTYSGRSRPETFPGSDKHAWRRRGDEPADPEWMADDEAPKWIAQPPS